MQCTITILFFIFLPDYVLELLGHKMPHSWICRLCKTANLTAFLYCSYNNAILYHFIVTSWLKTHLLK